MTIELSKIIKDKVVRLIEENEYILKEQINKFLSGEKIKTIKL